jgi:hypothetical protein
VSFYKTCCNINWNYIRIKYKYHYFNSHVTIIRGSGGRGWGGVGWGGWGGGGVLLLPLSLRTIWTMVLRESGSRSMIRVGVVVNTWRLSLTVRNAPLGPRRENNKMHGDGMFVDSTGRQWKGKFYNGQGPGLHTLPANKRPSKSVSPEASN